MPRTSAPVPAGVDPTVVSPARVYDYLLGGKDNYAVDREAAKQIIEVLPEAPAIARANRGFLLRSVRVMAKTLGIDQFLDLGSGLPTQGSVHQSARAIHPNARVVYVDLDPVVATHARARLSDKPDQTCVVEADITDPAAVLQDPQVRQLFDWSRPIGLTAVAVLHFMEDQVDNPYLLLDAYRRVLPSGSALALSHVTDVGADPHQIERAQGIYSKAKVGGRSAPLVVRSPEQIWALFSAGPVLLEPGLVPVEQWRPDQPQRGLGLQVLGGVQQL
ncbi:SAM-dependent methyltransferase [Actinomadura kijaniata]|uniref:SAM-dependent methyltransferase n=1 Tax=Actinomadura kijaniata TaxID=46161 RepID=UPI00083023BB|nr:SAM-dependent methyltransferase [Actinomadura kijaniata]